MLFASALQTELDRLGYKTIQQKADACGLEYEHMRQVLKGKHLSDDKIIEIGEKLELSGETITKMFFAKIKDKIDKQYSDSKYSSYFKDFSIFQDKDKLEQNNNINNSANNGIINQTVVNSSSSLSQNETELLKIFRSLNFRSQLKMITFGYELKDKENL